MASDPNANPNPHPVIKPDPTVLPVLAPPRRDPSQEEFTVYRHSSLFYWWPIWFFGYIMAAISYFSDWHMAIVPDKSEPETVLTPTKVRVLAGPDAGKELEIKDNRNIVLFP